MNRQVVFWVKEVFKNLLIVVISMIFAVLVRKFLLGALENRIVWVTFYPAVTVAAIYGGWITGMLSATSSCLIAIYGSFFFGNYQFIKDYGDRLGMFAFLMNCLMISAIAEAARRSRVKAISAMKEAEAANRAKSVFLAHMSHELRTPLNAVIGYSRLMNRDVHVTEEQKTYLGIINRSGEHLLNLINNVLELSKIEADHTHLEINSFNLHQMLLEIKELMQARADEKQLYLELHLQDELPQSIKADQNKVRQVLINLLGNAIKYTQSGGVLLRVKIAEQSDDLIVKLRFEVIDTGIGLSEKDIKHIFTPFVQADNRPTYEVGTGLGLTICKEYVEMMGGSLMVESDLETGSSFSFEIPVEAVGGSVSRPEGDSYNITGIVSGVTNLCVLIADDLAENRHLLLKILEPFGFEIQEVSNGKDAVALFEKWHPDLIWMDIRMPVMDGIEATQKIKGTVEGEKTKIIAITAHALEEERLRIIASGCDECIRKPYRETEIYEVMSRVMGFEYEYSWDLSRISEDLLNKLQQAVIELDTELTQTLISEMDKMDSSVAQKLHSIAEGYDYAYLLSLIEAEKEKRLNGRTVRSDYDEAKST